MKVFLTTILTLVGLFYLWLTWVFGASWNLAFGTTWFNIIVLISIVISAVVVITSNEYEINETTVKLYLIPGIMFVILMLIFFINSNLFQANNKYQYVSNFLKTIETGEIIEKDAEGNSIIANVSAFPNLLGEKNDTSNIPTKGIDEASIIAKTAAATYVNSYLSRETVPSTTASWTSQNINGTLSYVGVMEPKSMWKWEASVGNHGYFIVNRNNGKCDYFDTNLKTTNEAPFSSNTKIVIRSWLKKNGMNYGITDISPEVFDDGTFHYVATAYSQSSPGAIEKVVGIVDLNAETKELKFYDMNNIPKDVDRVIPESFFLSYIEIYGSYSHGFWNSLFGQRDVQTATEGYDVVYIDGICYYYTGWTSVNSEGSSIGIMMMNSRTGEINFHKTSGISEKRAQGVVEGKLQEKEYKAAYPLLMKVAGEETFYMLLHDNSNNLVGYAFVSYLDSTKVATGETLQNALASYIKILATNSSTSVLDSSLNEEKEEAITDIKTEVLDGKTIYYFRLTGNQIYTLYSELSSDVIFAKIGDRVKITYYPAESPIISVSSFEITYISNTNK